MITDFRPLPVVDYEVIYSGTLEAAAVRARQRAADPKWRSPLARSRSATDVVLEAFRAGRPGKVWSFVQLAAVTGLTLKTVSSAVGHLRRQGYVSVEGISFGHGGTGRQLRAWLAE